jgi:hypothetical protein
MGKWLWWHRRRISGTHESRGRQARRQPSKAAEAIIQITKTDTPPLRLPLGKVPMTTIQMKLDSVKKDMEDWQVVAEGAIFA